MAAPNIVNVAQIYGETVTGAIGTGLTAFLSNGSSSNYVYKVNTIMISNVDGSTDTTVRVAFVDNGTTRYLAYDIDLIAKTTLIVLSKDQAVYLEENDNISASCTTSGDAQIIISYEKIIDYLIEESFIENREDYNIPREVIAEASLSFDKIK